MGLPIYESLADIQVLSILADFVMSDSMHDMDTWRHLRELVRDVDSDEKRLIGTCQDERDAMVLTDLCPACQLSVREELVDLADLLHANALQRVHRHYLRLLPHGTLGLTRLLLLVRPVSRHLLLKLLVRPSHSIGILRITLWLHSLHAWLLLITGHLLETSTHNIALRITSDRSLLHFNIIVLKLISGILKRTLSISTCLN